MGTWEDKFNRRKPGSEEIADRIKDLKAALLVEDLLGQCERYLGRAVHKMTNLKIGFRYDLESIGKLGNPDITMAELRVANPELYYQIVGLRLYDAKHTKDIRGILHF